MSIKELREFLDMLTSHVIFDYNNKPCGIEPITANHYEMWYGDELRVAKNIDEVFTVPLFDDKSLNEIFTLISNLE